MRETHWILQVEVLVFRELSELRAAAEALAKERVDLERDLSEAADALHSADAAKVRGLEKNLAAVLYSHTLSWEGLM